MTTKLETATLILLLQIQKLLLLKIFNVVKKQEMVLPEVQLHDKHFNTFE